MATPAGAAWTVAATLTVALLLLLWPSGAGQPARSNDADQKPPAVSDSLSQEQSESGPNGLHAESRLSEDELSATQGRSRSDEGAGEGSTKQRMIPNRDLVAKPALPDNVDEPPSRNRPDPQSRERHFGTLQARPPIPPRTDERSPSPVAAPLPDPDQQSPGPSDSPKRVDVASALKQPIRRFEQLRPAPFREVLLLVEEMAGVPIRYGSPEDGHQGTGSAADNVETSTDVLEKNVSLTLENTTVGAILEELVGRVGLSYHIETDGIRLLPSRNDVPRVEERRQGTSGSPIHRGIRQGIPREESDAASSPDRVFDKGA